MVTIESSVLPVLQNSIAFRPAVPQTRTATIVDASASAAKETYLIAPPAVPT
jgi:hypothetical protein